MRCTSPHIRLLYLFAILIPAWTRTLNPSDTSQVIYLNHISTETIRLRSVLSIDSSLPSQRSLPHKTIFWIFKRIHSIPTFSDSDLGTVTSSLETSQKEQMISLDLEVESNLKGKYSLSANLPNRTLTTKSESNIHDYDLIINNLTYADSGLYVCNQWNQRTIYYQLVVTSPVITPNITAVSEDGLSLDSMIPELSNITLKCTSAHAYPYPSIKWLHNGRELSSLSTFPVSYTLLDIDNNKIESSLSLVNVSSNEHLSNFTCQLYQAKPTLNTAKASFTVNVSFKPVISLSVLQTDGKIEAISGSGTKLTLFNDTDLTFMRLFKANPMDNIETKWFLNGNEETSDPDGSFKWLSRSNRHSLSDLNMTLVCQVRNIIGLTQYKLDITLAYAPKIEPSSSDEHELNESQLFQFICKVSAYPEPTKIQWLHFSDPLQPAHFTIASNSSLLHIPSVTSSHSIGYFLCTARNQMTDSFGHTRPGHTSGKKLKLTVKFKPQMSSTNKPKTAADLSSTSHNLTCSVSAYPIPNIIWLKDGNPLSPSSKYALTTTSTGHIHVTTLKINSLSVLDFNSNYQCVATNILGSVSSRLALVPLSKPDKPTDLNSIYTNFMSTELTWLPNFDGGLPQTFNLKLNETNFSVEDNTCTQLTTSICVQKTGLSQVKLHNLVPNTLYNVQVSAYNRLGISEFTKPISIITKPLTINNISQIPKFSNLFFDVTDQRLHFTVTSNQNTPVVPTAVFCIRLDIDGNLEPDCRPVIGLESLQDFPINLGKSPRSLRVSTCYISAPDLCTSLHAIISPVGQSRPTQSKTDSTVINDQSSSIPSAAIVAISVSILLLLVLLFFTICYCIRKRNFKLCKSLLHHHQTPKLSVSEKRHPQDQGQNSFSAIISIHESELNSKSLITKSSSSSHQNKTFVNIDIASISAPIQNLTENSACSEHAYNTALNVISSSMTSSSLTEETINSQRQQRLVVEDCSKHQSCDLSVASKSCSSSTGVSNCSSLNNQINKYHHHNNEMYSEFYTSQQINQSNNNSTNSNSDPIVIDNSLSASSHSSSVNNSPTYGYNVTNATATTTNSAIPDNSDDDNLIYIKTGINTNRFSNIQKTHQENSSGYTSKSSEINTPPESGYSTPARLKKVVYEVIV